MSIYFTHHVVQENAQIPRHYVCFPKKPLRLSKKNYKCIALNFRKTMSTTFIQMWITYLIGAVLLRNSTVKTAEQLIVGYVLPPKVVDVLEFNNL